MSTRPALTIYPTRRKLEEAVARLVDGPGNRAAAGFGMMTLGAFEQRLSAQLPGPVESASPFAQSLILAKAMDAHCSASPGCALARARGFKGFTGVTLSFFNELAAGLVTPEVLEQITGYAPESERDIAAVYSLFHKSLADHRLSASGPEKTAVIAALGRDEAFDIPILSQYGAIVLRDIYQFTPFRFELFRIIALRMPVQIVAPAPDERRKAFGYIVSNIEKFENLGELAGELEIAYEEPGKGALQPLLAKLFDMGRPGPSEVDGGLLENVKILKCASRYREVEEIGLSILRIRERTGLDWSEFGVVFRDINPYAAIIEDVFGRYGVPFYFRLGLKLSVNPLVKAVLSIFTAIETGFERNAVMPVISSGYFGRFAGLDHGLARKLFIVSKIIDGPASAWRAKLGRGVEQLTKDERGAAKIIARETLALLNQLEKFAGQAHPESFFESFSAILESLAISADPPGKPAMPRAQKVRFRDNSAHVQLLETVAEAREAAEKLRLGRFNMGFDALRALFTSHLDNRYIPEPGTADTNTVAAIGAHDAAGLSFAHLCVGGLVEGEFPKFPEAGSILNEQERGEFNRLHGAHVRAKAPHLCKGLRVFDRWTEKWQEESLLFFQTVKAARESVVLTYPEKELDGRPLMRSQFVDDTLDVILPGAAAAQREELLEKEAPPPIITERAMDELADGDEKMTRVIKDIFRGNAPQKGEAEAAASEFAGRKLKFTRLLDLSAMARRRDNYFFEQDPHAKLAMLDSHSGLASDGRQRLRQTFAKHHKGSYSPTGLEKYGQCPFSFFAARALALEEVEEPELEMDAKGMGTLLHDIVERFYRRMIENNGLPLSGGPAEETALFEAAENSFAAIEAMGGQGDPSVFRVEKKRILGQLKLWLSVEAEEQAKSGFVPCAVETAFGLGPKAEPPISVNIPELGERFLGGKIDRTDVDPGKRAARIVDYKNSSSAQKYREMVKRENMGRTSFQPPIYMMLARRYVMDKGILREPGALRGGYRLLKARKPSDAYIMTDSGKGAQTHVDDGVFLSIGPQAGGERFLDKLAATVINIENGLFPVEPVNCDYCSFSALCGHIETFTPSGEAES
ncbi:MAG: PD-(D/E)XK nuclease family protein [Nitrospinae bacterium]|nr:PD-(D/E)XK nuclease family protein [Nitrospinota bacterium]